MRKRYADALRYTPQVLLGLSESWQPLLHIIPHAHQVKSVAFSPDASCLVSGSSDGIVRIWNTATGELESQLEGHTGRVLSVTFSHNGLFIASGSGDTTVRLWWNTTVCDAAHVLTLTGHKRAVMSVAISNDDKFVVSGSDDTTVRIWDTATGELLRELKGHSDMVKSVAVSSDCQHIASGSFGELIIWKTDGHFEHNFPPWSIHSWVTDIAYSHDGQRLVSCSLNCTVWSTMGHCLRGPRDLPHNLSCIACAPDDSEIVSGHKDGAVTIWNMDTNKTTTLDGHSGEVTSVAVSFDGSRIASGSNEKAVRIWDTKFRNMNENGHFQVWERLSFVDLSADGGWFVFAWGDAPLVQLWRVTDAVTKTHHEMKNYYGDGMVCHALARSGPRVVFGLQDTYLWVWNPVTGVELRMRGHSSAVVSVSFSYNGHHVVSGSSDKTIRIWDCHTGDDLRCYSHTSTVISVAFSRDGHRVVFASEDRTVLIWNTSTDLIEHKLEKLPGHITRVKSVAFCHDGSHVVISGLSDGEVWIWNIMANEFTLLSERLQLSNGTRIHSLSNGQFHIYDPADQEAQNDTPPYLLSISKDRDWIIGEHVMHNFWIPHQYRDFTMASVAGSIVCLGYKSRCAIILDLKTTRHGSTVLPVAHDPSLSPAGHRSHIPFPMRIHDVDLDDFYQAAMSSRALQEEMSLDSP